MEKKLKEVNILEMFFGPVGSFAGIVIFISGIVMLYFSLKAIVLIVFGAFVGFTFNCTCIDYERKRVRFQVRLFGFIPIGKWIYVTGEEIIFVELYARRFRTYSRANIPIDVTRADYRIFFRDKEGKIKIPLKKFKTRAEAEYAQGEYEEKLGILTK